MNTPILELTKPKWHQPALRGIIERRLLLNFRCAPPNLKALLPAPFRPKLLDGWGLAGICLIRLREVRPTFLPALAGLTSENVAHRISVEWDAQGKTHEGVFILRRDTNSLLSRIASGRVFPGVLHAASFRVWETQERIKLDMQSNDTESSVRLLARTGDNLPPDSVFSSLSEAVSFFRRGSLGWSARLKGNDFDGLELRCEQYELQPLVVEHLASSFFDNPTTFPQGTAILDSAFVMRETPHSWQACGRLRPAGDSIR